MFGANLSVGISSDLDKWAIRPEVDFMSGGIWNAVIGIMFTIPDSKERKKYCNFWNLSWKLLQHGMQ